MERNAKLEIHPFEAAGMGRGPYKFLGMVEMPDLSSNTASNFGNMNPYAEIQALGLIAGAGTCANCGMAIANICVVQDSDGGKYGVGCDCVLKTGDVCLSDPAKIAIAKHQKALRVKRAEKQRIANRAKWLSQVCSTGETNMVRIAREEQQRIEAEAHRSEFMVERAKAFADILPTLEASNEFHKSLASQLRQRALSPRQAEFVAKAFFHRRTNKNAIVFDAIIERVCQ